MRYVRLAVMAAALFASAEAFAQSSVSFSAPSYSLPYEGTGVYIAIHRSGNLQDAFVLNYSIPYSGNGGSGGTVRFNAGDTAASFWAFVPDDAIVGNSRVITVSVTYASGVRPAFPGNAANMTVPLHVTDDDKPPNVAIADVSVAEGNSGPTTVNVTITCEPYKFDWTFTLQTFDGSARAGTDYVAKTTSQIPVSANTTTVTYALTVNGDTEYEVSEHFSVRMVTARTDVRKDIATVTILNDDPGLTTLPTIERGSIARVFVDLAQTAPAADSLTIETEGNVLEAPDTVDFPAGSTVVSFDVEGIANGRGTIHVTLPASLGSRKVSASTSVVTTAAIVFTPAALSVPVGRDATAMMSMFPPQDEVISVVLRGNGGVDVWPTAVIPPRGSVEVSVRGRFLGLQNVVATPPPQYGGVATTLPVQVTPAPQLPTLTSIDPATGATAGGTQVTVYGSRLAGKCALTLGGIAATDVTVVSATAIKAVTPAHPAGLVGAALQCDGGEVLTLANAFTFTAATPSVSSVSPSFGSVHGGTLVRVTGANLHDACGVTFDGSLAGGVTLESPAAIVAAAPPHAAGRVAVGVRCDGNETTLQGAYDFVAGDEPPPSIASLSRLTAAPGETITISGARFRPHDTITFGGAAAEILRTAPDTHVVRVPDLTRQTVAVTVKDAIGRASTSGPVFDIQNWIAPQITAVRPSTAWPGAEIAIEGAGLRSSLRFFIDGIAATVIESDLSRVLLRVPEGVRTGAAAITTDGASTPAASGAMDLQPAGLTVASAHPRCAMTSGGITVTLTGTAFEHNPVVTFGGVASPSVIRLDAKTLQVAVPPNLAGPARIVVSTLSGATASLTNGFTYVSPMHPDAPCGDRRRTVRR